MMMILLLMRIDFKVVYYTLSIRTHFRLKFLIVHFTLQLEPFRRSPLIQSHAALYFCKQTNGGHSTLIHEMVLEQVLEYTMLKTFNLLKISF